MVAELRLPPSVRPVVEDIPGLLERHLDRPGLYVGLANTSPDSEFTGGTVFVSRDGGTEWDELQSLMGETVLGHVEGTLGGGVSGRFWDTKNTLRVVFERDGFTPANEPEDYVASGRRNLLLVGKEILGFATADPTGDTRTYDLSRLIRGRRNTEQWIDNHVADERVVLLSPPSSLQFVEIGYPDFGDTLLFRAVPFGLPVTDSIFEEAALLRAENVQPFSPIVKPAVRDSDGNIHIYWTPRSSRIFRLLGEASDFRLECCGCEQYEVDILSADRSVVLRTYKVLNRTEFVYTAARQVTDFGSTQSTVQVNVHRSTQMIGRGRTDGGSV